MVGENDMLEGASAPLQGCTGCSPPDDSASGNAVKRLRPSSWRRLRYGLKIGSNFKFQVEAALPANSMQTVVCSPREPLEALRTRDDGLLFFILQSIGFAIRSARVSHSGPSDNLSVIFWTDNMSVTTRRRVTQHG